ncbi:MAG: hypothetical protein PHD76_08140 [Methylacidiphilales bacterium]|nr:hypothetical protein [Candidatus Methylacidiphilales bacterium]
MIKPSNAQGVWIARFLSLAIFSAAFSAITYFIPNAHTKAMRIREDPRYAIVLKEIQENHLKSSDISLAAYDKTKPSFLGIFSSLFFGAGLIVGGYSLIYIFVSPLFIKSENTSAVSSKQQLHQQPNNWLD